MDIISKEKLGEMLENMATLVKRTEKAEKKVKELETNVGNDIAAKGYRPITSINSDEQRAMRAFGVSHPAKLLDVNIAHPNFKNVPPELKHTALTFKKTVDIARFTAQMFNRDGFDHVGGDNNSDRMASVKSIGDTYYGKNVLAPTIKAFGSTVGGSGDEWVPTAVSTSYLEEYELEHVLESRIQKITMPTNPFEMPKIKDVSKARLATEGQTNFGAGEYGTDKITFSAKKLQEFYPLPEELQEDSAPDFLSIAREEVIRAQQRAAESALINGDDDGTHIDSDTQAAGADVAEKAWDGWRKLALANSAAGATLDLGNAAITEQMLSTLRARMGKHGSNVTELLWIVSPVGYAQLLELPSVKTVEVYGQFATVLRGALASYQGIPIVNSQHARDDLSEAGVHDGVTDDRTGLLLVNTKRFYCGERRPIRVKLMPDLPASDRMLLASYRRVDFKGHAQSATEKSVVYGYNVAR